MARTSYKLAAGSSRVIPTRPTAESAAAPARHQELPAHESFAIIHPAACSDYPSDGGCAAGGMGRLPAVAGLCVAGGRLPDNSSGDLLSGSGSGCDGVVCDVAAGAAVWTSPRLEPDDLDQFIWQLGDHSAVWPRSEH